MSSGTKGVIVICSLYAGFLCALGKITYDYIKRSEKRLDDTISQEYEEINSKSKSTVN